MIHIRPTKLWAPRNGMILWWSFDGGAALDLSGNGRNGTIVNASSTSGKHKECLSFDATGDYVQAAISTGVTSATVALWVKPSGYPTAGYITGVCGFTAGYSSASYDKCIQLNSSGKARFYIYDGAQKYVISTSTISTSAWTHLVGTTDGSKVRIYVNGQFEADASARTSWNGATYFTMSVKKGSETLDYGGLSEDIMVWSRVLSAAEIAEIYNRSK